MPYTCNELSLVGNEWNEELRSPNAQAGIPGPGEWAWGQPDGEEIARRIVQEHAQQQD